MTSTLFKSLKLNDTLTLNNRILMAPLTRCMADDDLVPTDTMASYYARRADSGLIISEATIIRPDGQGYPNTPGLFNQAQVDGWKKVTTAVHNAGGKIFAQLWHVGRVAHPYFFGEGDVLAPSAIGIEGTVPRMRDLQYQTPKEASQAQIKQLVHDYANAAKNAIEAGFDGVEIHGANGYLIDQFLHYASNQRQDEYGETPDNMARFALEVVDAVVDAVGGERVGLRLSPGAYFNMAPDNRDKAVFDYLLSQLNNKTLAFVHVGIFDDSMEFDYLGGKASDYIRSLYNGTLVGVGGFTPSTAEAALKDERFDLVAIGRPFIANPDYVSKVKSQQPLTAYSDDMLAELI
ncbi:N-ethylmaleimide reductase [Pseudoalteromonas sp. CIP111854]|uniref:N-ethylmaleimide reductase n=1 Tax=Pseudoalteromonas holothuriae TaxID=2963714 RepID=A0A9W4VQI4_9GAMM|nr:alkene reductase [Pseudoalteromonas sp. CIP111854]CAH9057496.1 N-ethylmaleimide reductase [Pseudoalteromonas sp. CIP111854]